MSASWNRGAKDQIPIPEYLENSIVSSFVRGNCRLSVSFKPITGFDRDFCYTGYIKQKERRLVKIFYLLVIWNKEKNRLDEYIYLIFLIKKLPMWKLLFLLCILDIGLICHKVTFVSLP